MMLLGCSLTDVLLLFHRGTPLFTFFATVVQTLNKMKKKIGFRVYSPFPTDNNIINNKLFKPSEYNEDALPNFFNKVSRSKPKL